MDTQRAWAEIDTAALIHNYRVAKATGKQVMCVLKANAYGHGALACGHILQRAGADAFGVACLEEALELRAGGITRPILIFGRTPAEAVPELLHQKLWQTAVSETHAMELAHAAAVLKQWLPIHIKLDTGMSRQGISAGPGVERQAAVAAILAVSRLPGLHISGLYTHLAAANTPEQAEFTRWQSTRFQCIIKSLHLHGLAPEICHISNSPGVLYHPDTCADMVRVGSLLYGMYPDGRPDPSGRLRPVMTLKARISQIRKLPSGATVSYGRTFRCEGETTVAVVAAGYADGYPRQLSNVGYDVMDGKRCRSAGLVCMDLHCVDVSGIECAREGAEMVLWGRGGMPLEEVSRLTGMANCEIPCTVGARVPRMYVE